MSGYSDSWWKEGIIYQVYPRSFQDTNHDGVGDLKGILQRVPYLASLGVDIIWLSPVYQSPNDDNGYDISDYRSIMPEFGTMEDFDQMLAAVHDHGMKLLMDLVVNHSSDEHHWFQEAKKSKDNPYRDYYIWKPGKDGGPPNNWRSFFHGSAWEYDENTDEYFLHLFTKKQPDLNWENPKLRQEVYSLMKFWLDKGVDGFRMDVISLISKPQDFADKDWDQLGSDFGTAYANGPRVHEFLHEMHQEVLQHYDLVTVGEGVGIPPEQGLDYVGSDRQELHLIFHFGHMFIDFGRGGRLDIREWKLDEFTEVFEGWESALGDKGWGTIYLGNHDFPRSITRWGNDQQYWNKSAKMLATLLFTRKGTPTIYQGDEFGMTNVDFEGIEDYRDVEMMNAWKEWTEEGRDLSLFLKNAGIVGRDHSRSPVQWDDSSFAGFSDTQPWIKVASNYLEVNAASQEEDPDSILNYYRKAIAFRKATPAMVYGETSQIFPGGKNVYAYQRTYQDETYTVLLNFSDDIQEILLSSEGTIVLGNYPGSSPSDSLQPWEARVIRL